MSTMYAVGTPDYQFLKDFIDTMVGILFIVTIFKFVFFCLKYIFSPVVLALKGLLGVKKIMMEKSKEYIDNYEKNNKTQSTKESQSGILDDDNIIYLSKINKK